MRRKIMPAVEHAMCAGFVVLAVVGERSFDQFWSDAETIASSWNETKDLLERSVAFSSDSLHVITGFVGLLAASLILRRPVSSARPWLLVAALAALNELLDLWGDRWPQPGVQFGESIRDLLLTMALPTLLLFSSRYLPQLYARRREPGPLAAGEDSSTSAPS
jgi:hypothetical protein